MRLPLQRDIPVRRLAYYYKPNQKEPQYQAYNTQDFKFVKDEKGFFLGERLNVPSFTEEPRMPPEDQVRPWLFLTSTRIQFTNVSSNSITFVIKDPNNVRQYWGAVSSERSRLLEFVLKPDKKIRAAAVSVVEGATTGEEKLRKLYEFVQTQIHNVHYDQKMTEDEKKKIRDIKSVADILERKQAAAPYHVDWLFAAMAYSLGFDIRLAYTGNRNQMFFNPNMTNERLIHLAGIAVREGDNDEFRYLNPCDPFMPFGTLSWFEENSHVLNIGRDNFLWAETPALTHNDNRHSRTGNFKLLEDGTLEGDVIIEMSGQPAISFRQTNYDETAEKQTEAIIDAVKSRLSTAEVTEVAIENLNDNTKPLVQRYKVKVPNYAQKTGKRMFVQPSYFQAGPSALFSSSSRKYDIFFRYPWSEVDTINIQLPQGFELDNAETPAPFHDTNRIGSIDFDIKIDTANNILKVKRNFFFGAYNKVLFPANSYEPLKNVFDGFHKTDGHTITVRQK